MPSSNRRPVIYPELVYQMALTQVEGVGDRMSRALMAYCGSASEIFRTKKGLLRKIPGIGKISADSIASYRNFGEIEKEIMRMEKFGIRPLFFMHPDYPARLRNYDDSPLILYYRGSADLNAGRILSVVGTRRSTPYGKQFTDDLMQALAGSGALIVSGLASGTDTNAHRSSLRSGLSTVGVLGHGFGTIYPSGNRSLAREMMLNGGLLTEFFFHMPGSRENFPKRNRIVAGMCDALIVVESAEKGGSLITARLANDYNKDVYAVPGRLNDVWSSGCNEMIRRNEAAVISSIGNLLADLGYHDEPKKQEKAASQQLILTADERSVMNMLKSGRTTIDTLYLGTGIEMGKLSLILLSLEIKNLISVLPGKCYALR